MHLNRLLASGFSREHLKDEEKVLLSASETTKAMRQWRFKSIEELNEKLVLKYINEAIENRIQNKFVKADRNKPLSIPPELQNELQEDLAL